MPKRTRRNRRKERRPQDINQLARYLVDRSTEDTRQTQTSHGQHLSPEEQEKQTISRIMAEMGRKGGKIGGRKRAAKLAPQQRSDSASKAARVRWGKEDTSSLISRS